MSNNIIGILPAAGSSRRFGSNKLLHPLADGTPMAVKSGQNLLVAVTTSIAVIRPDALKLDKLLTTAGLTTIINPQPDRGIGSSISHAVQASTDATGWIIALADMPFIKPETIKQLVYNLEQGAAICVPFYQGKRGHPVGFSREFHESLLNLDGDQGASIFLKNYADKITSFTTTDEMIVRDIDYPYMIN
ncbi:MAG: nucleotidyltransferase family protein [Candidatus Marithrix sp.]